MAAADAVSPVPFFAFPFLWLQITLFIQQSIVGFDLMSSWKSRRAEYDTLMFLLWSESFSTSKVSVLTCGLASFHFMLFIEKKTRSMGSLAPGSACVNWNVGYYSRNIASYSICLESEMFKQIQPTTVSVSQGPAYYRCIIVMLSVSEWTDNRNGQTKQCS